LTVLNQTKKVIVVFFIFLFLKIVMATTSESQITEYKEAFCYYDRDHDGKIPTSDLGTVMRSLGKCVTQRQLREVALNFEDGFIDFAEFVVLMEQVPNIVETSDQIIACFQAFDRKKTGFISVEKLREVLSTLGEELSETEVNNFIERYCTQEEGMIPYEPLAKVLVAAVH
jgi:Ca2+-binding EF-hand superfamily protein